MRRTSLFLATAIAAFGCDATQLIVVVDTNFDAYEITTVEVVVRSDHQGVIGNRDWSITNDDEDVHDSTVKLPLSFGILADSEDPSKRVTIQVKALMNNGPNIEIERNSDFITDKILRVDMFIDRMCQGRACPSGETCGRDGDCQAVRLSAVDLPSVESRNEFEFTPTVGGGEPSDCTANPNDCRSDQTIGPAPGCACTDRNDGCEDQEVRFREGCVPAYRDGDSFDLQEIADDWADAICDYRERCSAALDPFERRQPRDCRPRVTRQQRNELSARQLAYEAGTVRFIRANYDTCMNDLRRGECWSPSRLECQFIFVGDKTEGSACSLGEECTRGQWCNVRGTSVCGACQARAALGARCEETSCDRGLTCATAGTEKYCVKIQNLGEACGNVSNGVCGNRLQCVDSVCVTPSELGTACDPSRMSGSNCDIFQNHTCVGGVCREATWHGPGEACMTPALCDNRGTCTNDNCVAKPSEPDACADGVCAPEHYCREGICQERIQEGDSCDLWGSCESGTYCRGPDPQRTECGGWNWGSCN